MAQGDTGVTVWLPDPLLDNVRLLAEAEHRSLNGQIIAMLEAYSPPLTGVLADATRVIEAAEAAISDPEGR